MRPEAILLLPVRFQTRPDPAFSSHTYIDHIEAPNSRPVLVKNIHTAHPTGEFKNSFDRQEFFSTLEQPQRAHICLQIHRHLLGSFHRFVASGPGRAANSGSTCLHRNPDNRSFQEKMSSASEFNSATEVRFSLTPKRPEVTRPPARIQP